MSGSNSMVQVEIVASLGQFQSQLKAAADSMAQMSRLMQQAGGGVGKGFDDVTKGADGAAKATRGILGDVKGWQREQVVQARSAKYLANTFAEIIPAADGARGAMAGFIGLALEGFSGGLGIGFAIEAAQLLGNTFRTLWAAEDEAQKKATEWGVEMRAQIVSLTDKAQDLADTLAGVTPTQKATRTQSDTVAAADRLEKERAEILARQKRMLELSTKPGVSKEVEDYTGGPSIFAFSQANQDRKRLKEIEEGIADARTRGLSVLRGEAAKAAEVAEGERRKQDLAQATLTADLDGELRLSLARTERQRAEAEYTNAARAAGIELRDGKITQEQLEQRINIAFEKRRQTLAQIVEDERAYWDLRNKQLLASVSPVPGVTPQRAGYFGIEDTSHDGQTPIVKGEGGLPGMYQLGGTTEEEARSRQIEKAGAAMREFNATQQEAILNGQVWGSTLGDALGGLISGTQSLGQVFAQVGQQIIQTLVEMAIQAVTANAASAGSAAASSQAGIPIVGPVLAISAMGAMVGAVLGLLGNIGARELGGSVYPSGRYLVGERGPELLEVGLAGRVTPNGALAAGGLGGAPDGAVNITFNAPVDATWWRQNERHIVRTLREASRSGRA